MCKFKLYLGDNGFFCCIHILIGCISIGILGLLVSILGFVFVIIELFPNISAVWAILALILVIVYCISKCLLLMGIGFLLCTFILLSSIFAVFVIFVAIIILICIMAMSLAAPLTIGLAVVFIVVEIYFAWVVVSYWHICTRCCEA